MHKKILILLLPLFFLISCDWTLFTVDIDIYPKKQNSVKLKTPWYSWEWVWIDEYFVTSELCKTTDKFIDELNTMFNNNVYYDKWKNTYNDVAMHWLYNYSTLEITTWIWWTWWWVWLSDYCIWEWYWVSSNADNIRYWKTQTLIFTMKEESDEVYTSEVLEKKDWESITIKWKSNKKVSTKKISTPSFNSPFIYFENAPKEIIEIKINSVFNNYKPIPEFNWNNSWILELNNDKISVNWEEKNNLFYELDLSQVDLNRNWRNFSSKDDLIDFLTNWYFFEKMWFTQIQKENSLNYLLPQIEESKNYYLTILSDESISKISQIKFSQKPEEFIRKYFAIYPTNTLVKTNWDLIYPDKLKNNNQFRVIETWEIYIKSNMFVFWE